jgi:hypothetical protein
MDQRLETVRRQSGISEVRGGAADTWLRALGQLWCGLLCQLNYGLVILGEKLEQYWPTQSLGAAVQEIRFATVACG